MPSAPGPLTFTPAGAPPRLPGRLAIAAEGHRARDVTATRGCLHGRLGAGRITAGDADPGAQRG